MIYDSSQAYIAAAIYHVWGAAWFIAGARFLRHVLKDAGHRKRGIGTAIRQSWNLKLHVAIGALSTTSTAFFWSFFNVDWMDTTTFWFIMVNTSVSIVSAIGHMTTGCLDPRGVWVRAVGLSIGYIAVFTVVMQAL